MDNKIEVYNPNRYMKISEDNPFKDDIERFKRAMRDTSRTSYEGDGYKKTKITVIEHTEYFPGSFSKVYQNKELLDNLSPDACKIFLHIALNMDYNSEKIKLCYKDIGLERRRTSRAIVELMFNKIIRKEKREWYWVNVTLIIVGNINKHE